MIIKRDSIFQRVITIGILVVILVAMITYRNNSQNKTLTELYTQIIDSASVAQIDSIVINKNNKKSSISFVQRGNDWYLTSKNYPVSKKNWNEFIEKIPQLRTEEKVSTNKDELNEFGLDSTNRTELILCRKGKEKYRLYFGKNSVGSASIYFNSSTDKDVYLSSGISSYILNRDEKNWIDKNIHNIHAEELNTANFSYADSNCNVTFKKVLKDSSTSLLLSFNGDSISNQSKIKSWIKKLINLKIDNVLNDNEVSPEMKQKIASSPNKISMASKSENLQWKFIKEKKGSNFIVYDNNKKRFFEVSSYLIKNLVKKP